MRFEVPQFLGLEDKLFGPFTFKQALYLAGGGAVIYLLLKFVPSYLAFVLAVPVGLFALSLVFYRPNGRPFIKVVGSFFNYVTSRKFYLWQNPERRGSLQTKSKKKKEEEVVNETVNARESIKDIARGLDILEKIPRKK